MPARVTLAGVSEGELDLATAVAAVDDPAAGATASFIGTVRNHDDGRSVTALEYHGHPTAERVVAAIAAEIAGRDGILAVAVLHRVGLLPIGGVAIVAAVSAVHRRAAFTACSDLVDEVKRRLPVWKRQVFADGTDEWVGSA